MITEELYVVNDTVLVKPAKDDDYKKADNGLWIKPTIKIPGTGPLNVIKAYVIKKGKGYPISSEVDNLTKQTVAQFIPLEINIGDEVYFIETTANIMQLLLQGEVYYILKQHNILFARTIID